MMTHHRSQRTVARPVSVSGVGFFLGADVTMRVLPAEADTGVRFQRVDLPGQPTIPALLEYLVPRPRRTALARGGAVVEMTEHVLAALAGLQIDNCVVQLNAPEPPGGDGSSLELVQEILQQGIVEQGAPRELWVITEELHAREDGGEILATPLPRRRMAITYELDYGMRSPIRPQQYTFEFTPESFVMNLAFARTFVLEDEVAALRAMGYGTRVTEKDLLIFGPHGPIGNDLRAPDECVRHKILDCLGDFSLLGCDVHGHFRAYRSGHSLNHDIARALVRHRERYRAA